MSCTYLAAALVILAVCSSARIHGAPIVIKELSYSDARTQILTSPQSLPFHFYIYEPRTEPTHVYASWLQNYSPADVGMSFFAPPEVVAGATTARNSRAALSIFEVNNGSIHSTPEPWWLGFRPGHYITAMEHVLDNLVISPIDETHFTVEFAERIRVWGEPIPEPRAISLLGIALSYRCLNRRIACGRRPPKSRSLRCPKSGAGSLFS
jgi:hypothetical protein